MISSKKCFCRPESSVVGGGLLLIIRSIGSK
jgi:hypothetical protein